jgi:sterol 3beta-glucosyltransferase
MHITLLTLGTRGDVQPFVALGVGLRRAGHQVTLVTAEQFAEFVAEHDLSFAPLDRRFLEMIDTADGKAIFDSGGNPLKVIRMSMPIMRQILHDSWAGAQGADAIIYHQKILAGYHLAEKLGIPAIMAMPLPVYPTRAFTNPIIPLELPAAFNRLSFAANSGGKAPFMSMINEWRRADLGLPSRDRFSSEAQLPNGRPIPVLHAYSPSVVPIPPDWPSHVTATGYWFLDADADWQPPADLMRFLESGPAPVYVGFGSMVTQNPAAKLALVIEALRLSGQRGVVAAGWAGLKADDLPDTVYLLDHAPHEWLFPRMAAVVHHGGAGTTAAGLRAGRPTVIAPFFGDQPFWGRRVRALGVGPSPLPQKKLTAEALAAAIHEVVTDDRMRTRAEALAAQIETEDGVGRAVKWIGNWLNGGSAP